MDLSTAIYFGINKQEQILPFDWAKGCIESYVWNQMR